MENLITVMKALQLRVEAFVYKLQAFNLWTCRLMSSPCRDVLKFDGREGERNRDAKNETWKIINYPVSRCSHNYDNVYDIKSLVYCAHWDLTLEIVVILSISND